MADGKWVATPAGQGSAQAGKGKGKDGTGAVRGKRETVIRKAGGKVWEDQTLLEWDPCEYRVSSLGEWCRLSSRTDGRESASLHLQDG